jgi:hypothetical protein
MHISGLHPKVFEDLNLSFSLGGTFFGLNNDAAVLGANYTISNMGGVVGSVLLIQLNSTVYSTSLVFMYFPSFLIKCW